MERAPRQKTHFPRYRFSVRTTPVSRRRHTDTPDLH
jgi:hypothetical protein